MVSPILDYFPFSNVAFFQIALKSQVDYLGKYAFLIRMDGDNN